MHGTDGSSPVPSRRRCHRPPGSSTTFFLSPASAFDTFDHYRDELDDWYRSSGSVRGSSRASSSLTFAAMSKCSVRVQSGAPMIWVDLRLAGQPDDRCCNQECRNTDAQSSPLIAPWTS